MCARRDETRRTLSPNSSEPAGRTAGRESAGCGARVSIAWCLFSVTREAATTGNRWQSVEESCLGVDLWRKESRPVARGRLHHRDRLLEV